MAPVFYMWVLMCLSLVHVIICSEETRLVTHRLEDIDEEISKIKINMRKLADATKLNKAPTRTKVKRYIKQQVKKAMADTLQGELFEKMVNSRVDSEMRKFKQEHHKMERQFHHVMSLRQKDEETNRDADGNATETRCKFVLDSLQGDLQECNSRIEQRITQNTREIAGVKQSLVTFIGIDQFLSSELYRFSLVESVEGLTATSETTTAGTPETAATATFETAKTATSTTTTTATPATTLTATSETTTIANSESAKTATKSFPTKHDEEMNRIIVTSSYSPEFRQLNIDNDTDSEYPYVRFQYVSSLAYVSKLRQLLVAFWIPHKIVSASLDSSDTTKLIQDVVAMAMAVDEARETVFLLTTYRPSRSISRMSTRGQHLTEVVRLPDEYNFSRAMAVSTQDRKIYVSGKKGGLLTVTYDGRTMVTSSGLGPVDALTLDPVGHNLYYNNGARLMKFNLPQNTSTHVTTLRQFNSTMTPWTLAFFDNTVYYGSCCHSSVVGAVNVRFDSVSQTSVTLNMEYPSTPGLVICFVH